MGVSHRDHTARSLGVLAALVSACPVLFACSTITPDPVQFAALALVDGKPTAVVITCGEPQIMVSLRTAVGADGRMALWSVVVAVPDGVSSLDVELLGETRPGWDIVPVPTTGATNGPGITGRHPEVVPLTMIDDAHEYVLDSSRPGTEFQNAPLLTFTTDDFTRIGSDEVLAATDYEKIEVISRDSFLERTRCD